jgi:riboflavin kinase/FMN adenylyltransferase
MMDPGEMEKYVLRCDLDGGPAWNFPRPLSMAIGTFDGVHLGHRKVVEAAVDGAKMDGGSAVVYTFSQHPTAITRPGNPKWSLGSAAEKYAIFKALGIAMVFEQRFDGAFAGISPEKFVALLAEKFPALREICVGENFTFGHGGRGDPTSLAKLAGTFGIKTTVIPLVRIRGEVVSSSRIRGLLAAGNRRSADAMLGPNLPKNP